MIIQPKIVGLYASIYSMQCICNISTFSVCTKHKKHVALVFSMSRISQSTGLFVWQLKSCIRTCVSRTI